MRVTDSGDADPRADVGLAMPPARRGRRELLSKPVVYTIAAGVFAGCFYAFLLVTGLYQGQFKNDALAWYFLAKGVFCATSLVLAHALLDAIRGLRD